jgi:hypothetical protein
MVPKINPKDPDSQDNIAPGADGEQRLRLRSQQSGIFRTRNPRSGYSSLFSRRGRYEWTCLHYPNGIGIFGPIRAPFSSKTHYEPGDDKL